MCVCILFAVVEDLFKSREPVTDMKAIYFMSPTAKVRAKLYLNLIITVHAVFCPVFFLVVVMVCVCFFFPNSA